MLTVMTPLRPKERGEEAFLVGSMGSRGMNHSSASSVMLNTTLPVYGADADPMEMRPWLMTKDANTWKGPGSTTLQRAQKRRGHAQYAMSTP